MNVYSITVALKYIAYSVHRHCVGLECFPLFMNNKCVNDWARLLLNYCMSSLAKATKYLKHKIYEAMFICIVGRTNIKIKRLEFLL